jgi:hypothetical protein
MATPNAPEQVVLINREVGAADSFVSHHDLGKIRIVKVTAIPVAAQAAHATILLEVKLGTPALPARYAWLTNDTDVPNDALSNPLGVGVSSAWVAKTAKSLDYTLKTVGNAPNVASPGNAGGFPEHQGVLELTVTKSGTTPAAGGVTVLLDYFNSD